MNQKPEKSQKMSRASYLLGIDLEQLRSHKDAAGAALDLEPHLNKIAEILSAGVPSVTILKIVSARLGISHHVAARAIQICLNGTGIEFKLPRGHRPKKTELGDDLQQVKPAATPAADQGAKKAAPDAKPAAPSVAPAPAAKEASAPAQARPDPPVSAAAQSTPSSPAPFPEIPRGELTHTERAEIAKKWIASQFGDKHPTQVQPDELAADAQDWLEKLWDKPAPVNPKTGQPYSFKRFTPDGRLTYNEPWWPPEAVAVEDDEHGDGYVSVHDAATRETIKKYKLRLASKGKPPYLELIVLQNGKQASGSFLRTDTDCLGRVVRDCAWSAEERRKNGAA